MNSTGGRWGIIGGLTVVMLFCSLVPLLHDFVLLGASAWVGATLFILGVDCFTRAGLKEVRLGRDGADASSTSIISGTTRCSLVSMAASFQ